MGNWYGGNRKLFRKERADLAAAFPLLQLVVAPPGFTVNSHHSLKYESAVVVGTCSLTGPGNMVLAEYKLALVLPSDYPKKFPVMYGNDPELMIGDIDRHIMADGSACLGVTGEIAMRWQSKRTVVRFLKDFVAPFLVWQAYYDTFRWPPEWGERSHLGAGILEFYSELLDRPNDDGLFDFIELLARPNKPKGHEICPCGSWKRLRDCHRELVYATRLKVLSSAARYDQHVLMVSGRS